MARLDYWLALSIVSLVGGSGCRAEKPPQTSLVGTEAPQPKCWRYQSLTAAIASATIECQGTIGPNSFTVDANGNLVPTFGACIPGATKAKSASLGTAAPVAPVAPLAAPVTPPAAAIAAHAGSPAPVSVAAASKASASSAPIASAVAQPAPRAVTPEELAANTYKHLTALLSIQQAKSLPDIQECLGVRWQTWKQLFARTNISTCPTWEKTEVIGAPRVEVDPTDPKKRTNYTALQIAKMQPRLPSVDAKECAGNDSVEARRECIYNSVQTQLKRDEKLAAEQKYANYVLPPKTSATYTVTVQPGVQCDDAAVCAAQCASAFPGFVLAASHNRVDGDATYWLSDEEYGTYFGYTHPMAQWNGPPGETFGHINRVDEDCWRWSPLPRETNGSFFTMRLMDVGLPLLSHCGPL